MVFIDGQPINGTVLNNQTRKGSNDNGGYTIHNLTYSNNTDISNDTYFRIFNNSTNPETGNTLHASNFSLNKFYYVNDSFDRRSHYLANYSNATSKQNFSAEAFYLFTDFEDNLPTYTRQLSTFLVNPVDSLEGNVSVIEMDQFIARDDVSKNSTVTSSIVNTTFVDNIHVNHTVVRTNVSNNSINSHNESYVIYTFQNLSRKHYSSNDTFTNYTTITILNTTVNLANKTNQTTFTKMVIKNWDLTETNKVGHSYTYNFVEANETAFDKDGKSQTTTLYTNEQGTDPTVPKRRILMQNKPAAKHFQGTTTTVTGGNFIWVSCFTGFGEASLININSIVDNQPTIDNCISRINAERPNFTVERLRVAVNTFLSQNPGAL